MAEERLSKLKNRSEEITLSTSLRDKKVEIKKWLRDGIESEGPIYLQQMFQKTEQKEQGGSNTPKENR